MPGPGSTAGCRYGFPAPCRMRGKSPRRPAGSGARSTSDTDGGADELGGQPLRRHARRPSTAQGRRSVWCYSHMLFRSRWCSWGESDVLRRRAEEGEIAASGHCQIPRGVGSTGTGHTHRAGAQRSPGAREQSACRWPAMPREPRGSPGCRKASPYGRRCANASGQRSGLGKEASRTGRNSGPEQLSQSSCTTKAPR